MDAAMLLQLKQDYANGVAAIAAGGGGSVDPFTPAVAKAIAQGWQDELPQDWLDA